MLAFHRPAAARGRTGCAVVLASVLLLVQLGLFAHVVKHQFDPESAQCVVCLTGAHLDDGLTPAPLAFEPVKVWTKIAVPTDHLADLPLLFRFFVRGPPIPPSA